MKKKFIGYFRQFFCIVVAGVLCFCIFNWWAENTQVCFAFTLSAIAYIFLCLYNILFKNQHHEMVTKILLGVMVIVFANKLYDYEQMRLLFPVLKKIPPLTFTLVVLVGISVILLSIKIMIEFLKDGDITAQASDNKTAVNDKKQAKHTNEGNISEKSKIKESNLGKILSVVFPLILIGVVCVIFSKLYNKGIIKHDSDFFEIISLLLKYVVSLILLVLAIVLVAIFILEMFRLLILRIKAFSDSLKAEAKGDSIPVYTISVVLDVIVCYLAYKYSGITMDTFYDVVNGGKYLAFPLIIIFIGIAFVIFLRLTHTTLLLLINMQPTDVKNYLSKVNEKTKIKEKVEKIVKMIIDLVLDSVITALEFVAFIPDYFGTIRSFVLGEDYELDCSEEKEDTDKKSSAGSDTTEL